MILAHLVLCGDAFTKEFHFTDEQDVSDQSVQLILLPKLHAVIPNSELAFIPYLPAADSDMFKKDEGTIYLLVHVDDNDMARPVRRTKSGDCYIHDEAGNPKLVTKGDARIQKLVKKMHPDLVSRGRLLCSKMELDRLASIEGAYEVDLFDRPMHRVRLVLRSKLYAIIPNSNLAFLIYLPAGSSSLFKKEEGKVYLLVRADENGIASPIHRTRGGEYYVHNWDGTVQMVSFDEPRIQTVVEAMSADVLSCKRLICSKAQLDDMGDRGLVIR